ncbi:MAG: tetratricopeptide repeat protein [Opitutaceae bacterium]|nr:tetratricopeptide repeat protein [Opitutaceae bacterium]
MDRIAHFSKLTAEQPDNALFRFSLAQALIAAERSADAEPHLRQCMAAKPDWMIPRILLGRILLTQGRRREARPLLEEALHLALEQHHEDPAEEVRGLLNEISWD